MPQSKKSSRPGSRSSSNTPSPAPSRRPRWVCAETARHVSSRSVRTIFPLNPLDQIKTGPRASTAWYAVDPPALLQSFAYFEPYADCWIRPAIANRGRSVRVCEELLSRSSPRWLMGWRDITNSTNARTTIADIIPFAAVGDKFLLMFPSTNARRAAGLLGSLNSFVLDFAARKKISGTSLKYFTMEADCSAPSRCLLRCRARIHGSAGA